MRAAIYEKYGLLNVLKIKELEKSILKDNEVLIRVYAATYNRTDVAMLRAKPFFMRFFTDLFKPNNSISGTDFAGTIEVVGKDIASFKVGDKVFGFNGNGLSSHAQYIMQTEDLEITNPDK